ncbi:MAG: amino acid adenylation domain-containing protein, partial [Niallia nealsonii]|nr:amino acid adenylation domain-containing protein [Niallia nealsonii]
NTLAFRNYPKAELTFQEFLADVKQRVLGAYEHADFPFEELVEYLQLPRDLSRSPIIDTLFTMQNMDEISLKLAGSKVKRINFKTTSQFDLSWDLLEGENLQISIEYSTHLFEAESINRMAGHYQEILLQIIEQPNCYLKNINLVTKKEMQQLLLGFNNTSKTYQNSILLHEIFELQATKTPNAIAVEDEKNQITYADLNRRANQLARVLRKQGVEKENLIGLLVERSVEMVIGIIGILKAGGAYVPIDPEYPEERINFILNDSEIEVLVTQEGLSGLVPLFKGDYIYLEEYFLSKEDNTNLVNINGSKDLAYLIYTSGSTGKPKGVMIEHEGVSNFLLMMDYYGIKRGSRTLQFASISFDVSVLEIIGSLSVGATICIVPEIIRMNPELFKTWLKDNKITVMTIPTSYLKTIPYSVIPCLKTISVGGELLEKGLAEKWGRDYDFLNVYGPTEAVIDTTLHNCSENKFSKVSIGKPHFNKKVYILDANLKLQPIGVPGELCISGIGIARGYLNRPELTKEKFLTNPFEPGKRLYRTG